ncbi:hypothetical protein Aperf_G00000075270 [Anoplocephala perfoliata]
MTLKVLVEKFCNQLACAHARRTLLLRVWSAWKRSLESTWEQRTHQRLMRESQQICVQLSQDYEIKIAELREKLRCAEERSALAEKSQTRAYESMKSALMRGVCALNMETMSIIQPKSESEYSEFYKNEKFGAVETAKNNGRIDIEPPSNEERNYSHNGPYNSRSLSDSRVKISVLEPVKAVTTKLDNHCNNFVPNTLLRTHTVEYGIPVGPSLYSSANAGSVRIQRHDSYNQVVLFLFVLLL